MTKTSRLVWNFGILILTLFVICNLCIGISLTFAQQSGDLEFTLDINSKASPLPRIFKPAVDLSGRGFHRNPAWPQNLASKEALDVWRQDIGFSNIYRLQYNLWEIAHLSKNRTLQQRLLSNYENVISQINDAGGIVVLDIFGTPAGLGKILDKKSAPFDFRAFKQLLKSHIKYLSCDKKYNVWYEVWSAPDLDDFFLGKKQEYLLLYRGIAEAVKELEKEFKIHIPLGGPGSSWWFQNVDGNTIVTPEHSLIYELIKFCYRYHLPLDFITWHGYSTDSYAEKEHTVYNKTSIALMRDWLTYFKFKRDTPLIVSEWNYDTGINVSPARREDSFIAASYIPSRLKNMYKAGLDYQFYFSLEDFQANKEGVVRNTGIFWFDSEYSGYKGAQKSIYNIFRMLAYLGDNLFGNTPEINDNFVDAIATKGKDHLAILIYNYIDPDIAMDYLSQNIATLAGSHRNILLNLVRSDKLSKILLGQQDIETLRLHNRIKILLRQAHALNNWALKHRSITRNLKLNIKHLKENYLYQRYVVDSSCGLDCGFVPVEEKEIAPADLYQETLALKPYSVNLIILKPKPKGPEPALTPEVTAQAPSDAGPAKTPDPGLATDAQKKE